VIFLKNPDREFYIQESVPLDWMYPHLMPHGLILKINRQPLAELPEKTAKQDHDYWSRCTARLIAAWLAEKTIVGEVFA